MQSGTATLTAGSALQTVTITAVDGSKSFLVFSISPTACGPNFTLTSWRIANGTTLTFQRSTAAASPVGTIKWYVAEFLNGVQVYRGSEFVWRPAHNVNIGATLDTAKSFTIVSNRSAGAIMEHDEFIRTRLTSGPNLELSQNMEGAIATIEWQVVGFTGTSVQSGDISLASGNSSKTDPPRP